MFKALQTYSSGTIVRWIEVPVAGQPAPDFPAPVLTLTPPAGATATSAAPAASSGSSGTDGVAGAALVLGVVNLAGVGLLAAGRRRRQSRTRATT